MKVTLLDLYNQNTQEAIGKLSESDKTDVLTARMVVRLLNASKVHQEELDVVIQKVNKLDHVKKFIKESNMPEVNKALSEEMRNAEIEIDINPLSFEQLHEAGLSPKEIYSLGWLLDSNQV